MKKIICLLLLLPLFSFAQNGGSIVVGTETITYDTSIETDVGVLYYANDILLASKHDAVMIVYKDDIAVREAHDTNTDGTYDTFLTLNRAGEVVKIEGDGASSFERPNVVEFSDLIQTQGTNTADDLVGSLDSISIPKYHNYTLYIFILVAIGAGYWWLRKKKK